MDGELVAIFDRRDDLVDVREVELRIDPLRIHVERDGDEAGVAGALAIAEQAAFDAVGAREQTEFGRSEEHTSELQSLMRNSYAVFCLKKQKRKRRTTRPNNPIT